MSTPAAPGKARCHPHRRDVGDGFCRECRQAEAADRVEFLIPRRLPGLTQHVFTMEDRPRACPHCHQTGTLVQEGRELRCRGVLGGCGFTAFEIRDERLTPTPSG